MNSIRYPTESYSTQWRKCKMCGGMCKYSIKKGIHEMHKQGITLFYPFLRGKKTPGSSINAGFPTKNESAGDRDRSSGCLKKSSKKGGSAVSSGGCNQSVTKLPRFSQAYIKGSFTILEVSYMVHGSISIHFVASRLPSKSHATA